MQKALPEIVSAFQSRTNCVLKLDILGPKVLLWAINRFELVNGNLDVRAFLLDDITDVNALATWLRGEGNIQDLLPDTSDETRCLLKDGVTTEEWDHYLDITAV